MGLTCGGKCVKVLLFIFNGLFFLAGAAMLGIGIWLMVDPNISDRFTHIAVGSDGLFKAASIAIIVVGAFILVIGFLGCCGACKESPCMLCTFIILLSIILVLEIVVAILAGVFNKQIGKGLEAEMVKQAVNDVEPLNVGGENKATSFSWHQMQVDLKCCGGSSFADYKNNTNFKSTKPVPTTCCILKKGDAKNPNVRDYEKCKREFNSNKPDTELFAKGCYKSFTDWIKQKAGILIGIAIGIIVIEIVGIAFACCLRKQLNRKKEYV